MEMAPPLGVQRTGTCALAAQCLAREPMTAVTPRLGVTPRHDGLGEQIAIRQLLMRAAGYAMDSKSSWSAMDPPTKSCGSPASLEVKVLSHCVLQLSDRLAAVEDLCTQMLSTLVALSDASAPVVEARPETRSDGCQDGSASETHLSTVAGSVVDTSHDASSTSSRCSGTPPIVSRAPCRTDSDDASAVVTHDEVAQHVFAVRDRLLNIRGRLLQQEDLCDADGANCGTGGPDCLEDQESEFDAMPLEEETHGLIKVHAIRRPSSCLLDEHSTNYSAIMGEAQPDDVFEVSLQKHLDFIHGGLNDTVVDDVLGLNVRPPRSARVGWHSKCHDDLARASPKVAPASYFKHTLNQSQMKQPQ